MANEELMAVISSMGYGYTVKVLVNGADIGMAGGKSESKRLFDKDNEMAGQATPEVRKRNFVLLSGVNTISVEYVKTGGKDDNLEITLEMDGYSAPLFKLTTNRAKGAVEKKITIRSAQPADFKPVAIAE